MSDEHFQSQLITVLSNSQVELERIANELQEHSALQCIISDNIISLEKSLKKRFSELTEEIKKLADGV